MYSLARTVERAHTDAVLSVAWCPKNNVIVTGGIDASVKTWTGAEAAPLASIQGHQHLGVISVLNSPDGSSIAASSMDSKIGIYKQADGEHVRTIGSHLPGITQMWSLAYHPDGKTIFTGTSQGPIAAFNVVTGENSNVYDVGKGGKFAMSVACSPDGTRVASAGMDGKVYLFDTAGGKLVHTIEAHAQPIRSLEFSPDSSLLLTGADDGHLHTYDYAHQPNTKVASFGGHTSWVQDATFAHDGKTVVSGSADTTVKVWDVSQRQCMHTFTDATDTVFGVAYSPDSKRIASVSGDKALRVYNSA